MIEKVAKALDAWIQAENKVRKGDGTIEFGRCTIRVVGQTALLEAKLDLSLLETADVDAFVKGEYEVRRKFDELLNAEGRYLDPDSEKVWMPEETIYKTSFHGKMVELLLAAPEYVLLSKTLKAPDKNRALILEYIARGPSELFLKLVRKYGVNLEEFV